MGSFGLPALSIRPAQVESPLDAYARIQQLRGQAQQQQLGAEQLRGAQLQNTQTQTAVNEDAAYKQALANSGGDIRKALPDIMKVAPTRGIMLQKQIMEWDKASIDQKKSILDYHQKQAARLGQIAGSVTDQPTYEAAINQAAQEQLIEPAQAQQLLATPYDPATVKGFQQQAVTAEQQIQAAQKAIDQSETHRHNVAQENKPNAFQEEFDPFYKAYIAAKNLSDSPKSMLEARQAFYAQKRPVNNLMTQSDAKDIADAIQNGEQPPTLQGLYRNAGPVRAELARRGVPLAQMESDWKATQKHIATLNGAQQERLRQAISFTSDSLNVIDGLYDEWKKAGATSGFKIFNKASLAAAKQLPGEAGSAATRLDAQINDLTSELGTVYKGGNGSTDESLKLAAGNLSGDWNETTFKAALKQIRTNLGIRSNSIKNSQVAGASDNNMYAQPNAAQQPSGITVTDPRGVVHSFPNQAAADQFKKAAGIQ
jgi:hypothetical protein